MSSLKRGLVFFSLIAASSVLAQSGQVITRQGDLAEPQMLHFSMPDFMELRQPDFLQRDLPTFTEKLVLSTEQTSVVERHIAEYLEAFEKLTAEHFPKGAGPMRIALGGGGDDAVPGLVVMGPGDDLGELGEVMEGEFDGEMPHSMNMDLNVRVGGPAPGEDPEDLPEGGVAVKIATPDGEELSPEMRAKLEEAAAKIAEQMKANIEKQIAEGGGDGLFAPGGMMKIEDIQNRQAEMAAKAEKLRLAKVALRQTFVTDVKTTVLTEDQIERWPALERTLCREKTLPKGRLSGERTDLVRVSKDFQLTEQEQAAVAQQLDAYELAMDTALRQRNDFLPGSETKINEALQSGEADKALSIVDRASALRIAVRSVNDQFAQVIASKLTTDRAAKFQELVLRTSFPSVYRTTYGQKAFAAAKKIEGLAAETLVAINDLEKSYAIELEGQNAQLRQTLLRHEPQEPRKNMERVGRIVVNQEHPGDVFDQQEQDPDPIRSAYRKRRELDERYAKLISSMLTPDQVAQLPKPPSGQPMQPVIIKMPVEPAQAQ